MPAILLAPNFWENQKHLVPVTFLVYVKSMHYIKVTGFVFKNAVICLSFFSRKQAIPKQSPGVTCTGKIFWFLKNIYISVTNLFKQMTSTFFQSSHFKDEIYHFWQKSWCIIDKFLKHYQQFAFIFIISLTAYNISL